ncbi:alpha/beta hydrolase [Salinarchaeum chitinilyticum]
MRPAIEHDDVTESGVYVAGNELRYLRAGRENDSAVLLLHGGIVDAAHLSWGSAIGPLAAEHDVYALDLLGYGLSDVPSGPYTTERHVDVVANFMDVVGLDSAHLVGTSLGGGIAIQLALEQPERVDKLVPVSAFGLGTELPNGRRSWLLAKLGVFNRAGLWLASRRRSIAKSSLGTVVSDPDSLPTELVDAFVAELQRPGAGDAYRSWRAAEVGYGGWNTYYYTRLDDLECPTLFVHGGQDELFPARWAERAAGIAPDGEVEVFEDAAHWLPRDRPDRFEELVTAYLRE